MASIAGVSTSFSPKIPQNYVELGIPESLVLDLVLRRLVLEGFSSLQSLSRSLRLSIWPECSAHGAERPQAKRALRKCHFSVSGARVDDNTSRKSSCPRPSRDR